MLHNSLPPRMRNMREAAGVLGAMEEELQIMQQRIEDIVKQYCMKSATWSLADWEAEFGLAEDSTLSTEQRRARLLSALNTRSPATKEMLANLVQQTLSAEGVHITEQAQEYHFTIYVSTRYLVENLQIAKEAVRKARPAHLAYTFINSLLRGGSKTIYVGVCCAHKKYTESEVNTSEFFIDG